MSRKEIITQAISHIISEDEELYRRLADHSSTRNLPHEESILTEEAIDHIVEKNAELYKRLADGNRKADELP